MSDQENLIRKLQSENESGRATIGQLKERVRHAGDRPGRNAVRRCVYCGAGEEVGLRPYGPNGGDVCFPCAMGTPERKAETGRMFAAQLAACGNVAVIGESVGPYPVEHADEAVQRAVTKALAGDE